MRNEGGAAAGDDLIKVFKKRDEAEAEAPGPEDARRGEEAAASFTPQPAADDRSGSFFSGDVKAGNIVHEQHIAKQFILAPEAGYRPPPAPLPIPRSDLDEVEQVYVAQDGWIEAERILLQRRLVVLHGPARQGKATTALYLLSRRRTPCAFQLYAGLAPLDVADQLGEDGAYLLDNLAAEHADQLDGAQLRQLGRRLEERRSYLVVTVDVSARLSKDGTGDQVLEWHGHPEPARVLDRHLTHLLGCDELPAVARDLLAKEVVQKLVVRLRFPGESVELARLLERVLVKGLPLATALQSFGRFVEQEVAAWFERGRDLKRWSFMISLALLSGSSYQTVADAAERLEHLVRPPREEDEPSTMDSLLGPSRSQRLKEANASSSPGYEDSDLGRSPADLVTLDDRRFQPAVLDYIWQEHSPMRRPLVQWLCELGAHPSPGVRAKAAAAVGRLSTYDFEYMRHAVLEIWAVADDRRVRVSTGWALGVPVRDREVRQQVFALLHRWATSAGLAPWTAAAALGGPVGLHEPGRALRELQVIVEGNPGRLFWLVFRSVANVFDAGRQRPGHYEEVLRALVSWTEGQERRGRKPTPQELTGLLLFIGLAANARIEPPPESKPWPTLLWLVGRGQDLRDVIVLLWRRALNTKASRAVALETLEDWLRLADEDSRLTGPCVTLIEQLSVVEHEADRLRHFLMRWAHGDAERPSPSSELALQASTTVETRGQ
jgi:hypothetical protein